MRVVESRGKDLVKSSKDSDVKSFKATRKVGDDSKNERKGKTRRRWDLNNVARGFYPSFPVLSETAESGSTDAINAPLEEVKGAYIPNSVRPRSPYNENLSVDEINTKSAAWAGLDEKTEELKGKDRALEALKSEDDNLKTKLNNELQKPKKLENGSEKLNGKNKKFSAVSAQSRRQVIYASVAFVLSEAFAVGASLTMFHLAICISLAVAALTFLAVGCYCLYKANTAYFPTKQPSSTR